MVNNRNFEVLLKCLDGARAKCLIVSAYAVAFYDELGFMQDIDV
jgi:hypothetical protein